MLVERLFFMALGAVALLLWQRYGGRFSKAA